MALFSSVRLWPILLVSAFAWLTILAAPLSDIDVTVVDPQSTGCLYDGKFYNETQTVSTKEPCLNCSCRTGALRCHLQVCPFLHDIYPPPAGCVLVERKNACCPKLHCPDALRSGNRLFRKDPSGKEGAWKVREDLRKRLVKHLAKSLSDKQGCVDSGTLYADGSAMMTSSTCEYCFCLKGKQTCVKPRCAEPELEGCTPRFRDLACCPTHYDCAISTVNATSVATKKIAPTLRRGDRVRPNTGPSVGNARGNDRIIDSSSTSSHHQKLVNSRMVRKKMLVKRSADIKVAESIPSSRAKSEEPIAVTLGPDHLTEEDLLSDLEAISAASFFRKSIDEAPSNDVRHHPIEIVDGPHFDSLAVEGSLVESRVPAPVAITELPEESVTVAMDDSVVSTAMTDTNEEVDEPIADEGDEPIADEVDEPIADEVDKSTVNEVEEPTADEVDKTIVDEVEEPIADEVDEPIVDEVEELIADEVDLHLPVSSRLDDEPELISDDELEADAAERNIEVSVSSSISAVSQSSKPTRVAGKDDGKMSVTVSPITDPSSANFLPIDNKTAKPMTDAGQVIPLASPTLAEEEEPLDYDYSNMELPPSLPNLEIIPFVAADAVMGVPNLEEDERLNLGGVMEQRTPVSQSNADKFSKTEHCNSGGNFYNHGELIESQPGEVEDPCKICRCMLGDVVCHETQCAPLLPGCHRVDQPDLCCGQVVCGGNAGDRMDMLSDVIESSVTSDKGQPEEKERDDEELKTTTTTTQSPSPILAFKVTFPPRPSSTLPPPPPTPSFLLRRFTSSRPTPRPTMPTTLRSFNSKFNKPAINNLVGVSAPFATGGLRIDSCNIYGQMYRVGRIIDELSGPCVECKCTEIGVNCVNLKC